MPWLEWVAIAGHLSFEENRGQAPPSVRFIARSRGSTVPLTTSGAIVSGRSLLRIQPVRAWMPARLEGLEREQVGTSYLTGNDPRAWITGIVRYRKVRFQNIYPGVDWIFHGNTDLEYDFTIAPGADPRRIRLRFEGAQGLRLDAAGNLRLRAGGEEAQQRRPVAYQNSAEIAARYEIIGENEIGFAVGPHDSRKPLVIDPTIRFSTYLGGSHIDTARAIAVDAQGNIYVAGDTASNDFPTTGGVLQGNLAGATAKYRYG